MTVAIVNEESFASWSLRLNFNGMRSFLQLATNRSNADSMILPAIVLAGIRVADFLAIDCDAEDRIGKAVRVLHATDITDNKQSVVVTGNRSNNSHSSMASVSTTRQGCISTRVGRARRANIPMRSDHIENV